MDKYINKIINADCLDILRQLPDGCVDLTVTSPPYDNLRNYNNTLVWSFDIFQNIAKELYRVTKDGGIVVWVVGDATVNGSETGTSFRQALYFMDIGFKLYDTMIWEKTARIPTQDRYYNVFEYMFVLSKGKPQTMNFICDHFNSTAGQRRRKDNCINKGKNIKSDVFFVSPCTSRRENIWRIHIGANKETSGHPAPFPMTLAKDHITTWSNDGDIVLDPFSGSGTTAVACHNLHRRFICIEKDPEYWKASVDRLERVQAQGLLF